MMSRSSNNYVGGSCNVLIVYDAVKEQMEREVERCIDVIRMRGDILRSGDTLVVLGILHTVQHPMGYHMKMYSEHYMTSNRATETQVSKKLDAYVKMLTHCARICHYEGINIEVKITAGYPIKQVILQEVRSFNCSWAILDRHFQREMGLHTNQIGCKVAFIQDDFSNIKVCKHEASLNLLEVTEQHFISQSKPVSLSPISSYNNDQGNTTSMSTVDNITDESALSWPSNSVTSSISGTVQSTKSSLRPEINSSSTSFEEQHERLLVRNRCSEAPILCTKCVSRTDTYYIKDAMKFNYPEIQKATNDFSKENLIGEGGFGHVYKGRLKDGQLIAAKVRKEESTQGFAEFHSEVYVLSFARHKNIVMLLGYCSKEKSNILVYEYICNKSLYWHLFDKTATALEWHQRFAIAIGIAKGLRFLHEECRGGPIIHRDVRPSNILLTHDFVPMLGDFGLAKWKTNDDILQTRVLGTLGYLAPEYAENGIVSVRTDVFAYGVVLLQLISGHKVVIDVQHYQQLSLRQWAEGIIKKLALHELIDVRIGDSYDTHELYLMAKAAFSCVQTSPELRPSMAEVVRLLEGENDHFHHFGDHFIPYYKKE